MACATLKRTLEYENGNTHPTKKRRCNFLGTFERDTLTTNCLVDEEHGDNCTERSSYLQTANILCLSPNKKREDMQLQAQSLRKVKIYSNIFLAGCEQMQDGTDSNGSENGQQNNQQVRNLHQHHHQITNDEKEVFTFKQVQKICERMLKDKDTEIRAEYESMLATKLAEQYDQFVKFTFDQIQNNYKGTPSYLT